MTIKYYVISVLFLLFLPFFFLQAQSCEPVARAVRGYTFIDPQLIGLEGASVPFSLRFGKFSKFYGDADLVKKTDNITEWWERFCEYPEKEDVADVIYRTPVNQLVGLLNTIYKNEEIRNINLVNNTFARYLKSHRCIETLDYLIFAKKCEPHCMKLGDPWAEQKRNTEAMRRLITEGLEKFRSIKSHYLRLRYAYQMVRLAHYVKDYDLAIELYDYCRPKMDNDPSIIDYWLLGHKAGVLMALGKNVEASYLYSLIFENCPSKRESAYLSFQINNDEEWQQCLNLCKADHERATLYVMRAGHADSRALEEMQDIYNLDPTNHNLENLLFREVKKLEKRLLGLGFRGEAPLSSGKRDSIQFQAGRYVIALQAFTNQLANEKKVTNPDLWKLAEGYLEVLAGDYYQARRTLREAKAMTKKEPVKDQIEIFELALQISDFSEVTDSVENVASRIVRDNEWYTLYRDFPDLLYNRMATLYDVSNDPGKAFLCRYTLEELKPNPQADILDNLIGICQSTDRNRMERELVEREAGETILNDVLDIKATYFLSRFQLEAALETYKLMPREKWEDYGYFNPFVERFHDCVHCALPPDVAIYNKGELIEKILDLEYEAKSRPEKSDSIYYQIGLAFYNITYFGQAWKATDYYRGWDSVRKHKLQDGGEVEVINTRRSPFGNRETFNCAQAEYFFNLARLQANDPEFAAKAAYMAAKCERNEFYVNRTSGAERTFKYFDILRDKYGDTKYYQSLTERGRCKTLIAYLQK